MGVGLYILRLPFACCSITRLSKADFRDNRTEVRGSGDIGLKDKVHSVCAQK